MKKVIKNIGILDLRNATEEAVKDIERAVNIGTVLYDKNSAPLMTMISFENLGSSLEVPENVKVMTGQVTFSKATLTTYEEPSDLFIVGQVTFRDDVTVEDIERSFKTLQITGQVLCPEHLMSALRSKLINLTGQLQGVKEKSDTIMGKLEITEDYLRSLREPKNLVILGKVIIIDRFDPALLEEKIGEITIYGRLLIREEYLEVINAKKTEPTYGSLNVIPRGHTYVKGDLELDAVSLEQFKREQVYVESNLVVAADVTEEMLRDHISALVVRKKIICPEPLRKSLAKLLNEPGGKMITYSHRFIMNNDEYFLSKDELEFMPVKVTYINNGEMEFDPEIPPALMMEKIEHLDNLGEITCETKQSGALQMLLRTRDGEINYRSQQKDTAGTQNVGYLKLG